MNCKNCQAALTSESDYCYSCGGKVIRNRLTARHLFENFSETFFNYDNKFLQTFIGLFKKPEDVIGAYIDGTRKKYVDVISYFALAITVSGLQIFIINKFYPEAMDMAQWGAKGQEKFQSGLMSFVQDYQSLIMMSYVPVYALISKIVFFNRKEFNYTEQLVIYMYIQAQISIISGVIITGLVFLGMDFATLGMFMFPLMVFYAAFCLKRLYQLSAMQLLLKTLIFLIVFAIIAILFTVATAIVMYFSGSFDALIEAKKAG